MNKPKPTIAVDFDGVLHENKKFIAPNIIDGDPVPGAMNWLRHLTSAFEVVIHSTRFAGYDGEEAVVKAQQWLMQHMIRDSNYQVKRGKLPYDAGLVISKLEFTATKPIARVYIDDRAWRFDGTFPTIPELLTFKTWQKR